MPIIRQKLKETRTFDGIGQRGVLGGLGPGTRALCLVALAAVPGGCHAKATRPRAVSTTRSSASGSASTVATTKPGSLSARGALSHSSQSEATDKKLAAQRMEERMKAQQKPAPREFEHQTSIILPSASIAKAAKPN